MSHETVGCARTSCYTMPSLPSDVLRSLQFAELFAKYRGAAFSVRTTDGWIWSSSVAQRPAFTATFSTRRLLDAVIADSTESTLAHAFVNGDLNIEGDVFVVLSVGSYAFENCGRLGSSFPHMIARALELAQWLRSPHGQASGKELLAAGSRDLPLEFFLPWLGSTLAHTCARWTNKEETYKNDAPGENLLLDQAQAAQLHRICQSLEIEAGDYFLDLDCEWGALILHAAQSCGAQARGIAATEHQISLLNERIRQAGMERRCSAGCRTPEDPFRGGTFDKVADVGVFKHVGYRSLRKYFARVSSLLAPEGLFLVHRMTRSPEAKGPGTYLLDGCTFPGTDLATLSEELSVAESAGFEVIGIDSLRSDYERTVRHWVSRLQGHASPASGGPSERNYRKWMLYLTEAAAALQSCDLSVHQILFRRTGRTPLQRSWSLRQ